MSTKERINESLQKSVWQYVMAILLAVALPIAVRTVLELQGVGTFAELHDPSLLNTTIMSSMAIIIGAIVLRNLKRIPSGQAGGAVVWSFVPSFALIAIVVIILRIDYSRYVLLSSLIICVAWYLSLHFMMHRYHTPEFAIVPGGEVGVVKSLEDVVLTWLDNPHALPMQVDGIVVDLRADLPEDWEKFIAQATLAGIPVYHYKQVVEQMTGKVTIDHLSENDFGSVLPDLIYLKAKMAFDIVAAILSLPVVLPICLACAALILVMDGRPFLFRQERIGFRGKIFKVYKFRTMTEVNKRPTSAQTAMTAEADDRITSIGQFLRKRRLDELPQVLNVLKGEMSWIGPRPEAVPLADMYEAELPFYCYRHSVRPGISGWAQVNQGHVTSVQDVHEKLKYDFYYIKYISLWLDFFILLKTIRIVIIGDGAK